MKRNYHRLAILLLGAAALLLGGCDKNNVDPQSKWSDSVFIINEGPFQSGSGTISAYDRLTGELTHQLFQTANGRQLGNIVQSMAVYEDMAFIAVNNANKIEVVNLEDFKSMATIHDITLPRYIVFREGMAYVSCWDNTVKVIDVSDFSVTREIQAGSGPDEMVIVGDELYVINSGGFGVDSTLTIIDLNDEELFGKMEVGHRPSGIVKDNNGMLWVLCSGIGWNGFPQPGDTPGKLVGVNPSSKMIFSEVGFPDAENHPSKLVIDGDGEFLYYLHPQGIFSFPVSGGSLSQEPLIGHSTSFYGLGIDPGSDVIYASDPLDYAQNGMVFMFNGSTGEWLGEFSAGVIPNGFRFN